MKIDETLAPDSLAPKIRRLWRLSAPKILAIERTCEPSRGAPVFTVDGVYTSRGWTEWTQGFQYGSALLQFEATRDPEFLAIGRDNTLRKVLPHATHMGVHDHGFNIVSTYGALLRMMLEGTLPPEAWERACYETALKCSAAVQARRWTRLPDGGGFIYSFNGPHSLFADTIRSLRSLALGHLLGHVLLEEHDERVSLLERLLRHAAATARYNVYYGKGRDAYDVRGRVAHESIFNLNDGRYRCPSSQQGFSPFSTWTRGLAWIMCGYAEELEFLATLSEEEFAAWGGRAAVEGWCRAAAEAACDFYIEHTAADGIPYWDTGAPHLGALGDWRGRPADPFNDHEPVDSSAAAIAAQGLLRLGRFLGARNEPKGRTYWQAGLTVLDTLFDEPYLAADPRHQGLILHSVYHRPNGWDHIPEGRRVPCGEASMWGDYHAREAALYLQRLCRGEPYLTFFFEAAGRRAGGADMNCIDLNAVEGRRYPAGRVTKNVVGGASPIASEHFAMGWVALDPGGGQVPWHNHDQEEVYLLLQGEGEVCAGDERRAVRAPAAVHVPPGVFHQLTNIGAAPLIFVYCYAPAGEVAHWRRELAGTLPRAGVDAPPLPDGACPQRTHGPE